MSAIDKLKASARETATEGGEVAKLKYLTSRRGEDQAATPCDVVGLGDAGSVRVVLFILPKLPVCAY